MAKKTLDISDFVGGINRFKSHRDLAPNEFLDLINLNPENLTYLKSFHLIFKTILRHEDFQILFGDEVEIENGKILHTLTERFNGRNIFVFTHDYSIIGTEDYLDGHPDAIHEDPNVLETPIDSIEPEQFLEGTRDFICLVVRGKLHIYDVHTNTWLKNVLSLDAIKDDIEAGSPPEDKFGNDIIDVDDRIDKYTSQAVYAYIDGTLRICDANFNRNFPKVHTDGTLAFSHTGKINYIDKKYFKYLQSEEDLAAEEDENQDDTGVDDNEDDAESTDDGMDDSNDSLDEDGNVNLIPNGNFFLQWTHTWDQEASDANMKNNLSIDYNNNPDNDSQSGGTVMEINALWEHRPLSSFDDEIQYRTVMVDGMEMTLNEMQLDWEGYQREEWNYNFAMWAGYEIVSSDDSAAFDEYNANGGNKFIGSLQSVHLNEDDGPFLDGSIQENETYVLETRARVLFDSNGETWSPIISALDLEIDCCGQLGIMRVQSVYQTHQFSFSGSDLLNDLDANPHIRIRIAEKVWGNNIIPLTDFSHDWADEPGAINEIFEFEGDVSMIQYTISRFNMRIQIDYIKLFPGTVNVNHGITASGHTHLMTPYNYTADLGTIINDDGEEEEDVPDGSYEWAFKDDAEGVVIDPWGLTLEDLGDTSKNLPVAALQFLNLMTYDTEAGVAGEGDGIFIKGEDFLQNDGIVHPDTALTPNLFTDSNGNGNWDASDVNLKNHCPGVFAQPFGLPQVYKHLSVGVSFADVDTFELGAILMGTTGFGWEIHAEHGYGGDNAAILPRVGAHGECYLPSYANSMMNAQDNCWGFMGGVMDGFFNTRTGWIDPEWITNMMPAATLSEDELPNKIPGMPLLQKIASNAPDNVIINLRWASNSGQRAMGDQENQDPGGGGGGEDYWTDFGGCLGMGALELKGSGSSVQGCWWELNNNISEEQIGLKDSTVNADKSDYWAPLGAPILLLYKRWYNPENAAVEWRFDAIPFMVNRDQLALYAALNDIDTVNANGGFNPSLGMANQSITMDTIAKYYRDMFWYEDPSLQIANLDKYLDLHVNAGIHSRPCNLIPHLGLGANEFSYQVDTNSSQHPWGVNGMDGTIEGVTVDDHLLGGVKFSDYDYFQIVSFPSQLIADRLNSTGNIGDIPWRQAGYDVFKDITIVEGSVPDPGAAGGFRNQWSDFTGIESGGNSSDSDDATRETTQFPIVLNQWKASNTLLPPMPSNSNTYGGWRLHSEPALSEWSAQSFEGSPTDQSITPMLKPGGIMILAYTNDAEAFDGTGSWVRDTYQIGMSYVDIDGNESKVHFDPEREIELSGERALRFGLVFRPPQSEAYELGFDERIVKIRAYIRKLSDEKWGSLLFDLDFEKGLRYKFPDGGYTRLHKFEGTVKSTVTLNPVGTAGASAVIRSPNIMGYEELNEWNGTDNIFFRYKCMTMINRRAYIGNVAELVEPNTIVFNAEEEMMGEGQKLAGTIANIYPDRMIRSPINQFDIFPESNFIDVRIDDGEEIIHLENFAGRIIQFRRTNTYIINCLKELEFLEDELPGKGISNPANCAITPFGLAWINQSGIYLYTGQGVVDISLGRLSMEYVYKMFFEYGNVSEPNTNMSGEFILSYNRDLSSLVIANSGSNMQIFFNLKANCWFLGYDQLLSDDILPADSLARGLALSSNIAEVTDGKVAYFNIDGLHYGGNSYKGAYNFEVDPGETDYVYQDFINLTTSDIDFGNPSVDKIIYSFVLRYRSHSQNSIQTMYKETTDTSLFEIDNNPADSTEGFTILTDYDKVSTSYLPTTLTGDKYDWSTVVIKPASRFSCKSFIFKILSTESADLWIDSISIIYRVKGIK